MLFQLGVLSPPSPLPRPLLLKSRGEKCKIQFWVRYWISKGCFFPVGEPQLLLHTHTVWYSTYWTSLVVVTQSVSTSRQKLHLRSRRGFPLLLLPKSVPSLLLLKRSRSSRIDSPSSSLFGIVWPLVAVVVTLPAVNFNSQLELSSSPTADFKATKTKTKPFSQSSQGRSSSLLFLTPKRLLKYSVKENSLLPPPKPYRLAPLLLFLQYNEQLLGYRPQLPPPPPPPLSASARFFRMFFLKTRRLSLSPWDALLGGKKEMGRKKRLAKARYGTSEEEGVGVQEE